MSRWARFDRGILPAILFVVLYLILFAGMASVLPRSRYVYQWVGVVAVIVASAVMMALYDRRFSRLGFFIPSARAASDFTAGLLWAFAFAFTADVLVMVTTRFNHEFDGGFAAGEVLFLLLPAVLHEELLFRGYAFQKLAMASRWFAVVSGSLAFAAAHFGNPQITGVAMANIFLAGLVLSLAFLWRGSLWIPIGMHLGWNVGIGPMLGHEISGYDPSAQIFTTIDYGPAILTGGEFGLEGSVFTTAVNLTAVVLLLWARHRRITSRQPVLVMSDAGESS